MSEIPKIIHYCWFGGNELPESSKRYIQGWKKKCSDYKIIRWSEKNFPVDKYAFTKKAYKCKDWAAVSDYARLIVIYKFGGIYLDIDVELLKSLNSLLNNKLFVGMEDYGIKGLIDINNGLVFGATPQDVNVRNLIDIYNKINLNHDFGEHAYDEVHILTSYFHNLGFKYYNKTQIINGCHIYPTYYFAPVKTSYNTFNINDKTYSIHHYFGSWVDKKRKRHTLEGKIIRHIIGEKLFAYLYRKYLNIKNNY